MRRATGFPPVVRSLIYDRSGGRCEICNEWTSDLQIHHRRPRGMGGSRRPDTNLPSSGLLLCGMDHVRVESHRALAFDNGWLVRQSQTPREVQVLRRGFWVYLDDVGGFTYSERTAS